ncbi:hypothetical protein OOU_Y34scaffold00289g9 [Pyricularia oryzae Y34]|uniref:Uncharacterized protein n=2 Tax=Pyricularia oryzae TaxID=318829 RepID=A0AA97PNL8_PYRO3|nr:hypothetical protein OOU_Y34scaffold00289g9 [Pyricularia oryzae Y34]
MGLYSLGRQGKVSKWYEKDKVGKVGRLGLLV